MADQNTENELQFDKAEFESAVPMLRCTACGADLNKSHFSVNAEKHCGDCADKIKIALNRRISVRDILKSLLFGFGASIVGFVIYFAILKITGYEIGLIAILVGFLVGKAVMTGSGNRGGIVFGIMAVCLTYLSIVSTYVPLLVEEIRKNEAQAAALKTSVNGVGVPGTIHVPDAENSGTIRPPASGTEAKAPQAQQPSSSGEAFIALLTLFGVILAVPFLAGASNIIGLIIIAFALFEAWRQTKKREVLITGPFEIAGQAEEAG